jgi:short-subunit dehydrogenase
MPGATATEFARVAGMEKTALFKQAYHAADVAKDGYEGLLQGKLAVVTGVNVLQRITLGMASWMPKKMILQQVRRMQELPKA